MDNIAQLGIKVDSSSIKQATNELSKLTNQSGKTEKSTNALTSGFLNLKNAVIGYASIQTAKQIIDTADSMNLLNARLKLATASTAEYTSQQTALLNVSKQSYTGISDTITLFTKLNPALKQVGATTEQVNSVVASFTKGLQLGGSSAQEASSAILQFSQAMGSGVLRGEEFNAINEASPKLMSYLAKGLGVAQGELRKMAENGELTATRVSNALLKVKTDIDRDFATLPITVGKALTNLKTDLSLAINEIDTATGATQSLANGIVSFSNSIGSMSKDIIEFYKEAKTFISENETAFNIATESAKLLLGTYLAFGATSLVFTKVTESIIAMRVAMVSMTAATPIIGAVSLAIYALSNSFIEGKTRTDNLGKSVDELAKSLGTLELKSRLVEVNKELKEMDTRFKNYSDSQKLMYQGGYDMAYKEKVKLEESIKLIEKKNTINKDANQTSQINGKIVRNDIELIKLAGSEYEKFNLTLAEKLVKMHSIGATEKELNEYSLSANKEFNEKQNKELEKGTKKLEETQKARAEIAQIGMSEYDKSISDITAKTIEWVKAGVSKNEVLSAEKKLRDELNSQTILENLQTELSYYEKKLQLQKDSLDKELDLKAIQYAQTVLNIENSDKTIEQKERLIALETELYDLSIAKLEEDSNTEFQDTLLEFQDEALKRQIDLNQAMYNFSGSFDGISGQISNVSKSMIAMSGISLKTKKAEIDLNKKYEKEFTKAAGNVAKTKALEIQYTKDSSELTAQSNEAEMAGYANLAGAMASAFEQGSAGAIAFTAVQSALGIASSWTAIAGAWALPFPANLPAVAAVTAAVMPIIAQLGGSSGGSGGGSVSIPSVADAAQETLDFENTMVVDRLDRQIELLEELNLQGSASKLQVQSAGLQFDYEKATSINTIRKTMEENLGAWQSKDQVAIFNSQLQDIGYKGDLVDYFMANSPFKVWEEYSIRTTGGIHAWWSQYIDVTDRQFMEMRNEFQNKMSDFAINVIGTINNLRDTGKDLKETYDELTDSQKYANIDLMEAIKQVDKLRGNRSFANYIEDEIENITKLEKELTPDRISLLLSEDIADMRAKVDLINYLSDQTGMAFENGAEDVLNYIDSIEAVSEMMTTSRDNIKSYLDSFKTSEQLLQDLADTLNLKVANSVDELNLLFNRLSSDTLGLTDAELELLEANKDYLESIKATTVAIEDERKTLKERLQDAQTLDYSQKLLLTRQRELSAYTDLTSISILKQIYAQEDLNTKISNRNSLIDSLSNFVKSINDSITKDTTFRDFSNSFNGMIDAIKLGSGDLSTIGNATIETAQSYLDTVARTAKSSAEIEFAKKIVANKFEGVINTKDITLGTINDTLKISFNEDSIIVKTLNDVKNELVYLNQLNTRQTANSNKTLQLQRASIA